MTPAFLSQQNSPGILCTWKQNSTEWGIWAEGGDNVPGQQWVEGLDRFVKTSV